MGQRPPIDLTRLTQAEKIIFGGTGAYFVWMFIPVWYRPGISGWHGVTVISGIACILALAWAALRLSNVPVKFRVPSGSVDVALGLASLLFTFLGLLDKPSWGLIVALILAVIWAYGAYMKYSEPPGMNPRRAPGTGF